MKRTGLHRLDCEQGCGAYVYATVANLEQHGLPACSCGARFVPDNMELALHLLADDDEYARDLIAEYQRAVTGAFYGQMKSSGAGHNLRQLGSTPRMPDTIAAANLEQRRREAAHARRVSGLRRGRLNPSSAAAAADDLPF